MYKGHRVGVVVPVYNEVEFVGRVLDTLPAFVDCAYPVDDRSTDGSWREIRRRATRSVETGDGRSPPPEQGPAPALAGTATNEGADAPAQGSDSLAGGSDATTDGGRSGPTVVGIRHRTNQGRGGAVKTGYRAALADGMDVVAVMDGDGQMNPDRLDTLLDPVVSGAADYAKGNRLATPTDRAEMSRWRLFGNALLTGLTRVASGYWGMTDPQNGYTVISRETLERLDVDALYDGYGFLNDVLVRLNVRDARIADVPVSAVYGDEESGIAYRSFVPRLSLLLLSRFLWRVRSDYALSGFHPVALFYGLAGFAGTGAVGVAAMVVLDPSTAPGALDLLGLVALPPVLIAVAFLLERRYNRHLEFDFEPDGPIDDHA